MAIRISCENDVGNLLAGIGNHEAKAIVFGGMQPGQTYSPQELHDNLFLAPQGDEPVHVGSSSNQLDYCQRSFEPAGLVTTTRASTIEYRLTKFGRQAGKSWAGHALSLSLEADGISLRSLFGMTRTNRGKSSRPPMDRVHIFRLLLDAGPDGLQAADIQAKLEVNGRTAVNNLTWLDRDGIVEYEAIDGREIAEHITYDFPETLDLDGRPESSESSMPYMIHETVRSLIGEGVSSCSLADFRRILEERYPDRGFDRPNRQSYALMVINELVAGGYIAKGPVGGPRKSNITLRDEVRPVVEQAVEIADNMLAGRPSFIKEGRERLEDILDDEVRVKTLIAKAFRDSPTANRIPASQKMAHARTVLADGPLSSSQAASRLRAFGMTASCSKSTFALMRQEGLVRSERISGGQELSWELIA